MVKMVVGFVLEFWVVGDEVEVGFGTSLSCDMSLRELNLVLTPFSLLFSRPGWRGL